MAMIGMWLENWAKNIHRLDESTINRDCGVRPYGLEYRIMLEGGIVEGSSFILPDQLLGDIDLAWNRIAGVYPDEMTAVREYYKRGSYRAVRLALKCSQHSSVTLVRRGEELITGALLILF
jgi:hypothetical protein